MSELNKTVLYAVATQANHEKFEFSFVPRHKKSVLSKFPIGLVASSDRQVRRRLAEIVGQCGIAPVVASNVAESGIALIRHQFSIVLCYDCLGDGNYEDIVKLLDRSATKVPIIVVSRTGGWTEYLMAIRSGAFDYLAYPPIPGDLQRVIRNALWGKEQHLFAAREKHGRQAKNGTSG